MPTNRFSHLWLSYYFLIFNWQCPFYLLAPRCVPGPFLFQIEKSCLIIFIFHANLLAYFVIHSNCMPWVNLQLNILTIPFNLMTCVKPQFEKSKRCTINWDSYYCKCNFLYIHGTRMYHCLIVPIISLWHHNPIKLFSILISDCVVKSHQNITEWTCSWCLQFWQLVYIV